MVAPAVPIAYGLATGPGINAGTEKIKEDEN